MTRWLIIDNCDFVLKSKKMNILRIRNKSLILHKVFIFESLVNLKLDGRVGCETSSVFYCSEDYHYLCNRFPLYGEMVCNISQGGLWSSPCFVKSEVRGSFPWLFTLFRVYNTYFFTLFPTYGVLVLRSLLHLWFSLPGNNSFRQPSQNSSWHDANNICAMSPHR